jgi:flavin reductase (DIM6/NTAB) family NADH-FMN oxidoreductase RutF
VDPAELSRDRLGLFPTGVAVITATTPDGVRLGATVSSFNSVSLDPPLVQFSLGRNANSLPAWESCKYFAANILAENQSRLSTRFAKAMTDKWDGVDPLPPRATDAPLRDALAHFDCKMWAQYDGDDHLIFIG